MENLVDQFLIEQDIKKYHLSTFREMAKPLAKILEALERVEDTRDEQLLKIYFFRDIKYFGDWSSTVYKLAIKVNKDSNTNKRPKPEELYPTLFGDKEDVFEEQLPAFISLFNDKTSECYKYLPIIKKYTSFDVFSFCKEYYQWLSMELSLKERMDLENVRNQLHFLLDRYPFH
jgi:hypothetical protein